MIAWQPRENTTGPWHLSLENGEVPAVSLCDRRVGGIGRYVKRDPLKIGNYGGRPCGLCWGEWRMMVAASYAAQDQLDAIRKRRGA